MRICFFGDSLVNGTGDDSALGWPGILMAQERAFGRDVTYYNLGIRRDTSSDIRSRWKDEAQRRLPAEYDRRLAFSFGTNDCVIVENKLRVAPGDALSNARDILTEAQGMAPVLMIGPPPLCRDHEEDQRIKALSDNFADLCAKLSVPFIETWSFVTALELWRDEALAGDGAHPNQGGYAALARHIGHQEAWKSWIKE